MSLASLTICYLYEIVMVICEIECQLTKESTKLCFISGHVNIIILTAEGILVSSASPFYSFGIGGGGGCTVIPISPEVSRIKSQSYIL